MDQLPTSITITIVLLTVFLCVVVVLGYTVKSNFIRTRLIMTLFFVFICVTLTVSFWQYTLATLPFTIPACLLGAFVGHVIGVRAAQQRLRVEGLAHYVEHFAHIHIHELETMTWWSFINFYSVIGALILINLVGFSTVIYHQNEGLAIMTSIVGAFLLGTIIPYLVHLWSINAPQNTSSTTREP